MRRRLAVPRPAFVLALLVPVVISCTRERATPDSARAHDSVGVRPFVSPTPAPIPGTLPGPIGTLSGDQFYAFTHGLTFIGTVTTKRRCGGSLLCKGPKPAKSTTVSLAATQGAWVAGPTNLPANGVVMALAKNLGGRPEDRYGLKPGNHFEYYLIITPGNASGTANWQFEQLDTTPGKYAHSTVKSGSFTVCAGGAPRTQPPVIPIGFYSCESSPHNAASKTMKSLLQAGGGSFDAPVWTGCEGGCCLSN